LFLKLECPGHGLDLQADRADLKCTVRRPRYAAVTDNGRLVGAATELDLPCGTEHTPCETRR
jgi:peroxiredoxin